MTGTGLLTTRCDPYGMESRIKLFGGVYPENMKGRYNWYCPERAESRFYLVCTGGDYGQRIAPDGGMVPAFHCEGGKHKGPADIPGHPKGMPLCRRHQRELGTEGYRQPKPLRSAAYDSNGHEQHWAPGSVVGGSKANEVCPACAMPPGARSLNEEAGYLTGQIGVYIAMGLDMSGPAIQMRQRLEQVRLELDHLNMTGQVHKCPLKLIEVS